MLVQQPKEHQQRPAATITTSPTAVSASGLIRSAHCLHASRRHHYIQLPADTSATTTTTSASISASTTGTTLYLSIICDKSVHTRTSHLRHQFHQQHVRLWRRTTTRHRRTSSPLRHQPAESRTSSRFYLEGHLVAGPSSVTPVLLRRLHLGTSQATYLFNLITLSFPLSTATNQHIHIYGYKDILLVCNNISIPVRFYICDVKASLLGLHDIFDNGIVLHINSKDNSSIEHQGENEPLYHHRSHLFIDAMAFDIAHRVHHH